MVRGRLGQLQYRLAIVFVVGWTGVVCGGLGTQFVAWDYPCPLCMVQRVFMLLAALGGAYIVRKAMTGVVAAEDYATGWGLAIVACVAGGFTSWRQTMLHILPGDPGYGDPVLGLHLYVWALILFIAAIATIGVVTIFAEETATDAIPTRPHRLIGTAAIAFLAVVIGINLVAVFLEEGFHWFLPDDPRRYEFFYDVGILR
ncbi:disulfide bond formation protein B [Nocardia pseudobrasiliensis]|uniref:Disulfide bond formation protein DsbB n=1 Tax=Nocardia pseudobrasiliensis TaxID=45979 RepID=A0A370HU42_9NOCA|nr:disulfide bond formation protein B [Nocardia pseudobrasiliensis]RDI61461.1 disulfide bond formation protein DsbB [Nocardia pseudobrasiliensis]